MLRIGSPEAQETIHSPVLQGVASIGLHPCSPAPSSSAWPWTMMSSSLPESLSSAKRATAADPKKWPQRLSSFYNYSGSSLQLPQTPLPSALICLRSNMIWFWTDQFMQMLEHQGLKDYSLGWRFSPCLLFFAFGGIWWVRWPTSLVSGNPAAVRGGLTLTGPTITAAGLIMAIAFGGLLLSDLEDLDWASLWPLQIWHIVRECKRFRRWFRLV